MFQETSKIRDRALPYCVGKGIDLGCGRDPITPDCVAMDRHEAPEVTLVGDIGARLPFDDETFDWVYSSHALEDFENPIEILEEWTRILKHGGNIILYVPHPNLYKGINSDHKCDGFSVEDLIMLLWECGPHLEYDYEILEALVHDIPREEHPCHSTFVVGRKL